MDNTKAGGFRHIWSRFFFVGVVSVVLSLVVLAGLVWEQETRLTREEISRKETLQEGREVRVVKVQKAPTDRPVTFTGEARPYATVTLYAKISGYLQEIHVDKGDFVEADEVIAKIDSPELNRQYLAAMADARNKQSDAKRARQLLASGAVSPQNAETTETAAEVAAENALAIKAQKNYELIKAPFDGTITARYADPGALLQAATGAQTTALPIATLSQTDRLRVYVYPDQKTASAVRVGDRVEIADVTRPDVKLTAAVSRTSGELDPKTRTLLVEIDLDNREGKILAGSFVEVTLFIRSTAVTQIPAQCLVMRGDNPWVAVVNGENKVQFRPVNISESDGRKIQLAAGVTEGERVVYNPLSTLTEGEHVQPVDG
jgi:membrane fusion protein, multidrug efflux system